MTEQLAGHKICIISTLTLNFNQSQIKNQELLNIFTTAFAVKQNDNLISIFLEYAGELHIIALRRGKGQNSQVTHTTTHPRHTPPPQPLGGSQFEK